MLGVVGVIFVAIGIMLIYISSEKKTDRAMWLSLIFGVLLLFFGAWGFISAVGIETILKKIAGVVVLLFGLFMIKSFPSIGYSDPFKNASVVVGILCVAVGAYLLFF